MRLSPRVLNRTLLLRQHLLARSDLSGSAMVEHLVGLQAQENLPPYLSLAARLDSFDPHEVSRGLEDRSLVRLVVMRGTIHLLIADDALTLRQWTQPVSDRERKASQYTKPALHVERSEFLDALSIVLADGPLAMKDLGLALAEHFPDVPPNALAQLARTDAPLAQVPPRGQWGASGGVVYQYVDRWVGRPLLDPDPSAITRRYLAAYGPASAADFSAWSALTRLGPVLAAMPDLVTHEDENSKTLYDLPDASLATGDEPAPVRLLGRYDNLWLSHAARDRVTDPAKRANWMGTNGGVGMTLFVDGMLEGLWTVTDGRPVVTDLFRTLTPAERSDLDGELERVAELLAR